MQRRNVLKYLGLAAGAQLDLPSLRVLSEQQPAPATIATAGIFLNQVGYAPHDTKVATVRGTSSTVTSFQLIERISDAKSWSGPPQDQVRFAGVLTQSQTDQASGDAVRQADFSSWTRPGTFRLHIAGHISDPITIADHIYADALHTTVRGYYGQRCGAAIDLGGGYKHPACHLKGEFHVTSGKSGPLPNRGGWHDAGDYGRYVVNSGITCGTLLWAWELFPEALENLQLGIPRQHPTLPDFLEEVLWNLDWMLQLQDEDGGVFQKQTSTHFCAFILPQDDALPSEVIGTGSHPFKSTCATADLASVMSIAARCYLKYDEALAGRFLAAARKAWTWARANPNVPFHNPPSISTGEYGDEHCADELLWASAELWRTTGEPQYEHAFLNALPPNLDTLTISEPGWNSVTSMACWTYALTPAAQPRTKEAIRAKTLTAAATLVQRSASNGYGNTLALRDYTWGSNGVAGNQSLLLAIANHFAPDPQYVSAALNNLHYIFGRNCHGVSWVTQVGVRPFMHPHHRPSASDNIVVPWPGLLSGGPNRNPGDAVAKTLPPMPPMRMWIDDTAAYSMNEIAINWNAPLVFLLAFANSLHTA